MRAVRSVVVVGAALIVLAPSSAVADQATPALPSPSEAELASSITQLDPAITQLEQGVTPLEPGIVDLSTESTDGPDQVVTLVSDILFSFGTSELSDAARTRVSEVVEDLPDAARVDVEGHTDAIGSTSDNLDLSRARAEAIATVLRTSRPDLTVSTQGFGESRPVAPNTSDGEDDPDGRAQNRRVEIRYQR